MKKNDTSKPVAKSAKPTQKASTAAASATPQPPEARQLRSSARALTRQDQVQNNDDSIVGAPRPDQADPPWRTRLDQEKWNEICDATEIVREQIERLRVYVKPPLPESRGNSQTPGTKIQSQPDVVKNINEFYSALAETGLFKTAAKPNVDSPHSGSGSNGKTFEFGEGGFIEFMRQDFETKLKPGIAEIMSGGMTLSASDVQNEGEDEESDISIDGALTATIDELWTTFEGVQDLVKNKIVSKSFSTIRKNDYPQLGIREEYKVPALILCQRVIEGLGSNQLVQTRIKTTWEQVIKQMEERTITTIDSFWNILSEESTRLLVNDMKYCLISSAIMFDLRNPGILCFPEFSLGSRGRSNSKNTAVQNGTAVTIKNKKGHTTRLTGSTDYFTFSLIDRESLDSIKAERSKWTGTAMDLYNRLLKLWALSAQDHDAGFVIVETKSPLTKVENHIPQVVAEAIALNDYRRGEYVPFCLTSGMNWIFGIVRCGNDERVVRRTTPMPFKPTQGGIFLINALLQTWISASPKDLWITLE